MAIKNASDLLVYKFTTPAQAQVTRIKIKTTAPFEDFTSGQTCILNNVTDNAGVVSDNVSVTLTTNSGLAVCNAIETKLEHADYDYTCTSAATSGAFKYIDCTNGANGAVPLLEVLSGTGTFKEGAVEVSIVTQGQTEVYEPVAHSTSASISVNNDLRDVTTKDSQGVQESLSGLKSYELSTDALIDLNANVDVQSFIDDIKGSGQVRLKYSDRIRNVLNTNLTQSGVDGFVLTNNITQTDNEVDPFGGNTASKLSISSSVTYKILYYQISSTIIEGDVISWTFYVKGDPSSPNNAEATFYAVSNSAQAIVSAEIISGDGTIADLGVTNFKKITGLNTGANNVANNWTRVRVTYNFNDTSIETCYFALAPGLGNAQVSGDNILTSSWQIEKNSSATTYQDPTDISCYSGLFLPTSINLDAGVEDNATYSASFSGSQELYQNGLGPELIEDTGFDDASYWSVTPGTDGSNPTIISLGIARLIDSGTIYKDSLLVSGDYYSLTYRVGSNSSGTIKLVDSWGSTDIDLPSALNTTFTVQFKAGSTTFKIEASSSTEIWLNSISLKKVAPQD